MISAVLNIAAPPGHVFAILTDYASYASWIPWCNQSTVLRSQANTTEADLVIDSGRTLSVTLRFEAAPPHSLRFAMIKSTGLRAYSGEYRFMHAADGQGTVIVCEIEIDAGVMVPKFVLANAARKLLNDLGSALQKRCQVDAARSRAAVSERKRQKRILQIVRAGDGYRIWYLGRVFGIKHH